MKDDARIENYAREVSEACPVKNKRKIKEMIRLQVMEYLEENPDAGMDEIYMTFGTPKTFAENYLSTYSTKELVTTVKNTFKYKRLIICILVFAVLLAAIIGVLSFMMAKEANEQVIYECKVDGIDISISVVAEVDMSDEEFAENLPNLIEQLKEKYNITE